MLSFTDGCPERGDHLTVDAILLHDGILEAYETLDQLAFHGGWESIRPYNLCVLDLEPTPYGVETIMDVIHHQRNRGVE